MYQDLLFSAMNDVRQRREDNRRLTVKGCCSSRLLGGEPAWAVLVSERASWEGVRGRKGQKRIQYMYPWLERLDVQVTRDIADKDGVGAMVFVVVAHD